MKRTTLFVVMLLACLSIQGAKKSKVSYPTSIPYSQFYGKTLEQLRDYLPKGGCAFLELSLTGEDEIASVNVRNRENKPVAGPVAIEGGALTMSRGMNFIELNCRMQHGAYPKLGTQPLSFKMPIMPGEYPAGFDIAVTTPDKRVMFIQLPSTSLKAGQTVTFEKAFTPDPEILFYEGFDTMVWGGDYVGGMSAASYGVSQAYMTDQLAATITGYEPAIHTVSYNIPGTTYCQSDDYKLALAAPVATAEGNLMTESYMKSRGIWEYYDLFRCIEHPGYLGIGDAGRGIFRTCPVGGIKGIRSVKVSFDLCPKALFDNDIEVYINNGGYIASATIDGQPVDGKQIRYRGISSILTLTPKDLKPAAKAIAPKKWLHVEMDVERATDGMDFEIMTAKLGEYAHAFFIDNIKVVNGPEMERGKLRVLYWNIQNGMWYDQPNNYDNFVKWVQKYDPDICVWCEASSIYLDNTQEKSPTRYLPDHWGELAARYGHSYAALGEYRDNYPQEVTSKYPIETLKKIGSTGTPKRDIAHGAAVQKVTVDGQELYFVTMHTWPQKYAYGLPREPKEIRQESGKRREGDRYREFEMKYVVENTIKSPEFAGVKNWILLGDLNSRSRADQWHFGLKNAQRDSLLLLCQDQIRDHSDMIDIIATKYPGDFMASTHGNSRIDNMYASPAVYAKVKNAMILVDGWNGAYRSPKSPYVKSFYEPSDHRPILVDFDF